MLLLMFSQEKSHGKKKSIQYLFIKLIII